MGQQTSEREIAIPLHPEEWAFIMDLISDFLGGGRSPRQQGVNPFAVYDYLSDKVADAERNGGQS